MNQFLSEANKKVNWGLDTDIDHRAYSSWVIILVVSILVGFGLAVVPNFYLNAEAANTLSNQLVNSPQKFAPGEILIKFNEGLSSAKSKQLIAEWGYQEISEIPQIKVKRLKVPQGAETRVVAALSHNPNVEFVELNGVGEEQVIPNDPGYSKQWYLPNISAPAGWDIQTGSSTIIIASIDTSVDSNHQDLVGKLALGFSWQPTGDSRHGTYIAGVAAASADNGLGVTGVSWGSKLMPLDVGKDTAGFFYADMAAAFVYAADNGARVITTSLAAGCCSSTIESAVNYAWNKGSLITAAAGNQGSSAVLMPALYANAISVGATDSNDTKASWSNFGKIDVVAPGVGIYTTADGNSYQSVSGTSLSTPMVAGLAALVWSQNPTLTNLQVRNIIQQNADDLGAVGVDEYFGSGKISVQRALQAVAAPTPTPTLIPTPTPTSTATSTPTPTPDSIAPVVNGFDAQPRTTSGNITISWNFSDAGGSHLSRAEIQRAKYHLKNCNDTNRAGCSWATVKTINAPADADSWTSNTILTQSKGIYWYGIHAIDNAGNRGVEVSVIKVTR